MVENAIPAGRAKNYFSPGCNLQSRGTLWEYIDAIGHDKEIHHSK
jgi:hypothetical protein